MIRLFIALPLEKQIEDNLGRIANDLKQVGGHVKWVNPENIHLTIKFLGNTEEDFVDKLKAEIDRVAGTCDPILSRINRLGGFPNLKHPRVIWAGFSDGVDRLTRLAHELDERISQLGWEREQRDFKAHLTLGRVKDAHGLDALDDFVAGYKLPDMSMRLDRIVLFKSTLTQQGPIYKRLHERPLSVAEQFGG